MGEQLLTNGQLQEALVQFRTAYSIAKRRAPGTATAGMAAAQLAEALAQSGACESAILMYSEAIEILDYVLPHSAPDLSLLMNRKVSCLSQLHRDDDARHLMHSIFERASAEHYQVPVEVVARAHDMARMHVDSGDLISAALLYEDTIPVIQGMSGSHASDHLWSALSDLADLYEKADIPISELAALQQMGKLTPADASQRCDLLFRLTSAALRAGHPFEAQETLQEAWGCVDGTQAEWLSWVSFQFSRLNHPGLAQKVIDRAIAGPQRSKNDTALLLSAMAIAYSIELDACQAERVAKQAVSLLDKSAPKDEIEYLHSVKNTAAQTCHHEKAAPGSAVVPPDPAALAHAREDLEQAEKKYAADSQSVLARRFNLGIELQRSRQYADACRELGDVAMRFTKKTMSLTLELSRVNQISEQQGFTTHLIDELIISCLPVSGAALAGPLLHLKGHVMEGIRQEAELSRLDAVRDNHEIVQRLRQVRASIANALLAQDAGQRDRAALAALAALTEEKERLERQLSAGSDGFVAIEPLGLIGGLTGLRRSLSDDEIYVDFTSYRPWRSAQKDHRLLALVISRDSVAAIDLRLAPILALRDSWLTEIANWNNTGDASVRKLSQSLITPILAVAPRGIRHIIISSDDSLHDVPWQIPGFAGPEMTAWLVPTARELVRWKIASDRASATDKHRVSIVDRVNFDDGAGILIPESDRLYTLPDTLPDYLSKNDRIALTVVSGVDATSESLSRELGSAEMLHIHSHGVVVDLAGKSGIWSRNPFSSSALALTGANRKDTTGRRLGLVTAEQLVGLAGPNLRVITLAMCDSGQGAGIPGQGNLGFVTALSASGTPDVIASARSASVESANVLFPLFYERLLSSSVPREAFDFAVAAVRKQPTLRGARHWANWLYWGYDRPSSAPTLQISRIAYRLCTCRSAECWNDPHEMDVLRSVLAAPGLSKEDQDTIVGLEVSLKQCQPEP